VQGADTSAEDFTYVTYKIIGVSRSVNSITRAQATDLPLETSKGHLE
jgi:hypothetical protein